MVSFFSSLDKESGLRANSPLFHFMYFSSPRVIKSLVVSRPCSNGSEGKRVDSHAETVSEGQNRRSVQKAWRLPNRSGSGGRRYRGKMCAGVIDSEPLSIQLDLSR